MEPEETPRSRMRRRLLLVSPLLASCSTQQVINVALSKDPQAAARAMAESQVEVYKRNPQALVNDFNRITEEVGRLFTALKGESAKRWGKTEAETLPGPKRYVKYSERYRNRVVVDYESYTIKVEHLDETDVAARLRSAIVVTLLTPEDPARVDMFSDRDVALDGKPFLQELVVDQDQKPLRNRADVERYAQYLVTRRMQRRSIVVDGANVGIVFVEFDMVGAAQVRSTQAKAPPAPEVPGRPPGAPPAPKAPIAKAPTEKAPSDKTPDPQAGLRTDPNYYAASDRIAPKFLPMVDRFAQAARVDPALVLGVIFQESRFNPYAVSPAGACGLMQLVPSSGGLDAYRRARGESVPPTREFLMDPSNNIELGTTYLNILLFEQWMRGVTNLAARDYCATAAYNTGPGNVARAFTGTSRKLDAARDRANGMTPDALFDFLRANLPYEETRDYLPRVSSARLHYQRKFYAARGFATGLG
jgi:soluble lytic murein transglycosylase-like protein